MPLYKIIRTTFVEADDREEAYDLELSKNARTDSDIVCVAPRVCSECGQGMHEGYLVGGGEYYCTEDCLHKNMTEDEWLNAYAEDPDNNYYTEWEIDDDML